MEVCDNTNRFPGPNVGMGYVWLEFSWEGYYCGGLYKTQHLQGRRVVLVTKYLKSEFLIAPI